MGISQYIKEIGRGPRGSKPLTREQAADLFGQLLDGNVTDLEIGAFCLAMRIKGETPEEMCGFLDAAHSRMALFPASDRPVSGVPASPTEMYLRPTARFGMRQYSARPPSMLYPKMSVLSQSCSLSRRQ